MLGRRTAHVLGSLPLTVLALIVLIPTMLLGLVLYPIFLGQVILAGSLGLAHGFAGIERRRLAMLGIAAPEAYHRTVTETGFRRFRGIASDGQRWRDLAHQVLSLVTRVLTLVITVVWWALTLGGLTFGVWGWFLPKYPDRNDLLDLLGWHGDWVRIGAYGALGLIFLAALPVIVRGMAGLDAALAKALLSNDNAALRERIDRLAATRAAAMAAEAETLRRVERDIHDGPQQRLVRLTMDLEAAQRRLVDSPADAAPLLLSALTQTQEALAELRALSRGIAPPVLSDRGLAAALASSAARCPVRTSLDVDLDGRRLAPAVENAAYFVVTEALTNVAKHAHATEVTVSVRTDLDEGRDMLRVRIADDGVGGAHVGKGQGLAGLADRVAALDGYLEVASPSGGPTVVTASVPVDIADVGKHENRRGKGSRSEVAGASRPGRRLTPAARRPGSSARRSGVFRRRSRG